MLQQLADPLLLAGGRVQDATCRCWIVPGDDPEDATEGARVAVDHRSSSRIAAERAPSGIGGRPCGGLARRRGSRPSRAPRGRSGEGSRSTDRLQSSRTAPTSVVADATPQKTGTRACARAHPATTARASRPRRRARPPRGTSRAARRRSRRRPRPARRRAGLDLVRPGRPGRPAPCRPGRDEHFMRTRSTTPVSVIAARRSGSAALHGVDLQVLQAERLAASTRRSARGESRRFTKADHGNAGPLDCAARSMLGRCRPWRPRTAESTQHGSVEGRGGRPARRRWKLGSPGVSTRVRWCAPSQSKAEQVRTRPRCACRSCSSGSWRRAPSCRRRGSPGCGVAPAAVEHRLSAREVLPSAGVSNEREAPGAGRPLRCPSSRTSPLGWTCAPSGPAYGVERFFSKRMRSPSRVRKGTRPARWRRLSRAMRRGQAAGGDHAGPPRGARSRDARHHRVDHAGVAEEQAGLQRVCGGRAADHRA